MLQSIDTLIAFVTLMTICSLFVLIIVQMISAALSLRGKNLCNALALTFQTVAPELKGAAHKLAWRILCDPVLSDSVHAPKDRSSDKGEDASLTVVPVLGSLMKLLPGKPSAMRLANAIRPEEVMNAIRKIATSTAQDELKPAAQALLNAVQAPSEVQTKLSALNAIVAQINNPDLNEVKVKLESEVQRLAQQLVTTTDAVTSEVKTWLDTAQDRAQQWFQTHTRGFTIAVSIVLAFACQWDAVEIYNQVSTNPTTRDSLVRASAEVVKQGDLINDPKGGLINRIVDEWNKNHKEPTLQLKKESTNTNELRKAVELMTPPALIGEFDKLVTAQKQAFFDEKQKQLDNLSALTQQAGYKLMPDSWLKRWGSTWCAGFCSHFFGMALFAALLTLGAPYWFNMLAKLANLRPAIAQLMGEKQEKTNTTQPS